MPGAKEALEKIRELCAELEEVEERVGHGAPCFYVRKKIFLTFLDNHHNDGRLAVWCKAAPGAQDTAVRADPKRYFVPPYVGHQGWVGLRLEGRAPWAQVRAFVRDGWRLAAPKKLLER